MTAKEYCSRPRVLEKEMNRKLEQAEKLNLWVTSVRNYATKALIQGRRISGFKLAAGRSSRRFSDPEAVGKLFPGTDISVPA